MARRRRRRTRERQPEPAEQPTPRTSIARVEYPDQDTLRLRTFWSPAPTWVYGAVPGLLGAIIAVMVTGTGGNVLQPALIGGAVGYFGGGVIWAVLGAVGGDLLLIEFDLKDDRARVHQSMLWLYQREFEVDIDAINQISIHVRRARPILLLFTSSFTAVLKLEGGEQLSIGRFPTEGEVLTLANEVSDFLGCDLDRTALER